MKKIEKSITDNAMNYQSYRTMIDTLYEEGKATGNHTSEAMLNYTKLNVARMRRLDKKSRLSETIIDDLKKLERPLTWLVITEGWCGDAAQIIPVLHQMAEASDYINLKLILRDENLDIMDAFLTNNARSIPVLIVLDAETNEVLRSWGPRPMEVQQMVMDAKAKATSTEDAEESKVIWDEAKKNLQLWYAKDKTLSIQREVIEVL